MTERAASRNHLTKYVLAFIWVCVACGFVLWSSGMFPVLEDRLSSGQTSTPAATGSSPQRQGSESGVSRPSHNRPDMDGSSPTEVAGPDHSNRTEREESDSVSTNNDWVNSPLGGSSDEYKALVRQERESERPAGHNPSLTDVHAMIQAGGLDEVQLRVVPFAGDWEAGEPFAVGRAALSVEEYLALRATKPLGATVELRSIPKLTTLLLSSGVSVASVTAEISQCSIARLELDDGVLYEENEIAECIVACSTLVHLRLGTPENPLHGLGQQEFAAIGGHRSLKILNASVAEANAGPKDWQAAFKGSKLTHLMIDVSPWTSDWFAAALTAKHVESILIRVTKVEEAHAGVPFDCGSLKTLEKLSVFHVVVMHDRRFPHVRFRIENFPVLPALIDLRLEEACHRATLRAVAQCHRLQRLALGWGFVEGYSSASTKYAGAGISFIPSMEDLKQLTYVEVHAGGVSSRGDFTSLRNHPSLAEIVYGGPSIECNEFGSLADIQSLRRLTIVGSVNQEVMQRTILRAANLERLRLVYPVHSLGMFSVLESRATPLDIELQEGTQPIDQLRELVQRFKLSDQVSINYNGKPLYP